MPITPYSHIRNRKKSEAGNPRIMILLVFFAVIAGGVCFLGLRDIPAPKHAIEKVIANERFIK